MLYKSFFPFILFAIAGLSAVAQQQLGTMDFTTDKTIRIFDTNGKVFTNSNGDYTGSPYFNDAWKYGQITLTNNNKYSKRLIRLDLETQQIHYLSETNVEMALPAGLAKQILIFDSTQLSGATQYIFEAGYPRIDNQEDNYLYQIVADGKVKMLKSIKKKLKTEKNDLSGEISREYESNERFYIYTNKQINRLPKDKDAALTIFFDKKDAINKFISTAKFSFKKVDDVKALVDYYNSLF